eukprot:GEMP01013734.1.p2 GENE.GEMP01013734.1~~GEMP01013734.1.p2  ORF type:complete len:133 (-),score=0.73 GEMP01013734.1:2092-2490(-)
MSYYIYDFLLQFSLFFVHRYSTISHKQKNGKTKTILQQKIQKIMAEIAVTNAKSSKTEKTNAKILRTKCIMRKKMAPLLFCPRKEGGLALLQWVSFTIGLRQTDDPGKVQKIKNIQQNYIGKSNNKNTKSNH